MSIGNIVQCIGAVVDIEFPRDAMPKVYDALVLEEGNDKSFAEKGLTFEVQQQLATAWCVPLPWARRTACAVACR